MHGRREQEVSIRRTIYNIHETGDSATPLQLRQMGDQGRVRSEEDDVLLQDMRVRLFCSLPNKQRTVFSNVHTNQAVPL